MAKQDGGPSIAERIANGSSGIYFIPADNARKGRPMVVCFSTCRDSIRTIPVHAEKAVAAALERRGRAAQGRVVLAKVKQQRALSG